MWENACDDCRAEILGIPPTPNWSTMLEKQKAGTRYYSKYLCRELRPNGETTEVAQICHFGDSSTIRGVRIGGKVCLTEEEACEQLTEWNARDSQVPNSHFYSLYAPERDEYGTTPPLPGMSDWDMKPRTRAEVGHVVGQGGCCWCGERHADAVPGDPVSMPWENEGLPLMGDPRPGTRVTDVNGYDLAFVTYGPTFSNSDPGGQINE